MPHLYACAEAQAYKYPKEENMMSYPDNTLLKGSGPEIYVMEGGCRRRISNPIIFITKGYDWNKMFFISDQDLNAIPMGEPLTLDRMIPTWYEADLLIQSRLGRQKVC